MLDYLSGFSQSNEPLSHIGEYGKLMLSLENTRDTFTMLNHRDLQRYFNRRHKQLRRSRNLAQPKSTKWG